MAGFGPAPKNGRRNKSQLLGGNTIRILPGRRDEPPPEWPFGRPLKTEATEWARQWAKPMAAMWEYDADVVARYVQLRLGTGEAAQMPTAARLTEVRQLEDRLGLTVMARLRLRWTIDEESEPETEEESGVLDIRKRLAGS